VNAVAMEDVRSKPIDEPPLPAPTPRGEFVSARYESDCARFLAETKDLSRRRAEAALTRPSLARSSMVR
jgi:hypothetical protein